MRFWNAIPPPTRELRLFMKPRFFFVSLWTCLGIPVVGAADVTWNGVSNGNWSTAANWSPAALPAVGDNVTIANTTTNGLTLDGTTSRSIGRLTFGTTGTRTSNFTLNTLSNTLTLSGGVVANGAFGTTTAMTMRGNYLIAADQTWAVGGSNAHATDQGVFVREVTTGAANRGSLTLNGNLTKTGAGQLSFAAIDVTGAGNLIIESGDLKLNAGASQPLVLGGTGNLTMNGSSVLAVYKNSGTMSINRAIVMNGTSGLVTRNNTVDIVSNTAWNGTHTLDAGGVTNLAGAWTGAGTVNRIGAGVLTLSGNLAGFGGTLSVGAGTTQIAGDFGGSLAVTGGSVNLAGAAVGGTLTVGVGGTLVGEVAVAGAMTLSGGTIAVNPVTAGSLGTAGDLTLSGTNTVTLTGNPQSTAPFTVLTYGGNLTGGVGNLVLAGGSANYRTPTFSDATSGVITLAVGSESRTWNGGASWDVNTSTNWLGGDQKFLQLDSVSFTDVGAGAVTMVGALMPSSIVVSGASDYSFVAGTGGLIAGATGFVKEGAGTVSVAGANTYTGGVFINAGVFKAASNQALGANGNTVVVAAGGALDTSGVLNTNRDYQAVVAGAGVDGSGAIVNSSATGQQTGFRSLTLTGDATIGGVGRWDVRPIVAGQAVVDLNGYTLTKAGANLVALVDGVMTNQGSVEVTQGTLSITRMVVGGAGTVRVSNGAVLQFENNTTGSFNKELVVDGATVRVSGNAYAVGPQVTLANAAVFDTILNLTIQGDVSGSGNLTKSGAGSLILAGNAVHGGGTTVSAGILQIGSGGTTGTLTGDIANSGTVVFDRSDALSYGGVISGTGAVTKQGAGILNLTSGQSYSGATTVNAGSLRLVGGDNRLPVGTAVTMGTAAGAVLDLNGANQEIRSLTGGAATGGHIVNTGVGTSTLTLRPTGTDGLVFAGQVAGDIRVVVAGDKTAPGFVVPRQRFAGTESTYTGGTVVDGATLMVRLDGSLGAVPGSFDALNIVLRNNGTLLNEADANVLTLDANRGIRLESGGGALVAGFNSNVTVRGVISGGADDSLTVLPNNGTLIFTGDNTYAGGTVLQPVSGANVSRLQIGDGGTSGTLGAGDVLNDGVLTFNRSDASSYHGSIRGGGTLTKQGAGTLTLGGTSTYTGATTVSAGTLWVTGALGETAVGIANDATLGGNGTIAGGVTLQAAGSRIAPGTSPGTSPGTLTVGTLDLANGAILEFELGSVSDRIDVLGALTAGVGLLDFRFADAGGLQGGTAYTLMTFASSTGLDYGDLAATVLPGDYTLDPAFGTGGWQINPDSLQVRFVPEPATSLLVAGGLVLAGMRRRRVG